MMTSGIYTSASEDSFVSDAEIRLKGFYERPHATPEFVTPLPEEKDFAYWSDRFKRRAEESLETEEVRNHVEIKLPETSLISFIGDIHAGNAHTDYQRLEAEISQILATPSSFCMMLGDTIDNFFWFPPAHEADSPVPDQIEYSWALLHELAKHKKLLVGWTGNHDHTWSERGGNSLYKRFSRETGAYLMSGVGYVDITVGDQQYKICGAHQLLGYSYFNPNHPQTRNYLTGGGFGADVVVSAHTHSKGMQLRAFPEYGNRSRRVLLVNVGAYKTTDGFIRDKGFGDKSAEQMYGCSIIVRKDQYNIIPSYDILEAHRLFAELQS